MSANGSSCCAPSVPAKDLQVTNLVVNSHANMCCLATNRLRVRGGQPGDVLTNVGGGVAVWLPAPPAASSSSPQFAWWVNETGTLIGNPIGNLWMVPLAFGQLEVANTAAPTGATHQYFTGVEPVQCVTVVFAYVDNTSGTPDLGTVDVTAFDTAGAMIPGTSTPAAVGSAIGIYTLRYAFDAPQTAPFTVGLQSSIVGTANGFTATYLMSPDPCPP